MMQCKALIGLVIDFTFLINLKKGSVGLLSLQYYSSWLERIFFHQRHLYSNTREIRIFGRV